MEQVRAALDPLEQEGRIRVLQWAAGFFGIAGASVTTSSLAATASSPSGPAASPGTSGSTIAQFVRMKRPRDTYQRLACLAYFLDKNGTSDLKGNDLTQANIDARQPKISNMSQFFDLAVRRHHLFAPSGNGRKRLTDRGSALVDALPDQEAVSRVLREEHPLPKKGGRKPGKKKPKA